MEGSSSSSSTLPAPVPAGAPRSPPAPISVVSTPGSSSTASSVVGTGTGTGTGTGGSRASSSGVEGAPRRRAPLVAAAALAAAKEKAGGAGAGPIDLTDLSDSDDPVAVSGPSGGARAPRARSRLANGAGIDGARLAPPTHGPGAPPQLSTTPSSSSRSIPFESAGAHGAAPNANANASAQRTSFPLHQPHISAGEHDSDISITASTAPNPSPTLFPGSASTSSSVLGPRTPSPYPPHTTTASLSGPSTSGSPFGGSGNAAGSYFPNTGSSSSPFAANNAALAASLSNASAAAHAAGFGSFARSPSAGTAGNGFATGWSSRAGAASPNKAAAAGDGSSSAPIDVERVAADMPSSSRHAHGHGHSGAPHIPDGKKAVCIGAFMSRAIMLYPNPAAIIGTLPAPPSRERWTIVNYKGAEMIHVKLKLRRAGAAPRPDEPWTSVSKDTIQVTTQPGGSYIGDLDSMVAEVLIPMLHRGLCRLEGFAMRLRPGGPMYEVRINVLMFTLPSNIQYIADTLIAHNLFLLDPMPPYDPQRHNDHPEYRNAHGSGDRAYKMYLASQRNSNMAGGYRPTGALALTYNATQDKARNMEVQRQQVDAVFKSIDSGAELEQSDPGPWIKTDLFPHQRKALTFLLQAEQDWSSLKQALKKADKLLRNGKKKKDGEGAAADDSGVSTPEGSGGEVKETKEKRDLKGDASRSLWESELDEKGRPRLWKNKVTGDKLKASKRPKETKGAILADDMGLGKTLSVVSLIAATHSAAREWSEKKLEKVEAPEIEDDKPKLSASVMTTKVFDMPEESVEDASKGKKRRRDDDDTATRARRAQITRRSKATLLVCPMSTITNWEDQIKEHWNGRVEVVGGTSPPVKNRVNDVAGDDWDLLRVYIYHGTSRKADPRFLAEFDIVITSYSTLANEYSKHCNAGGDGGDSTPIDTGANTDDEASVASSRGPVKAEAHEEIKASDVAEALKKKQSKGRPRSRAPDALSPLQTIDWFRVVLDEAHSIKSASTVACKASCNLEADRRIALTGTPIQNKIEDVWALFKFLRLHPVDDKEVFNKYIHNPCRTGEQIGIARLQLVMRACCLRRTKDTTDNGRKILSLPPRREMQTWLQLRPDERAIYDQRLKEAKSEVEELKDKKQLTKNYAHVLQQLLRLRQTCDHVDLPNNGVVEEDYDGTIMDYEVALAGIEKMGLSQQRAQSVVCTLKDMPDGATCSECSTDFGPSFPSIDLGGAVDYPPSRAESVDRKGKSPRPLLTKCRHILCVPCFKRSVFPRWPRGIEGQARQCPACDAMLQLKSDVIEVCPPSEMADELPKRTTARKKWERNPTEAPSMSTKMEFLLRELIKFSKRNKYSPNYDPFGEGGGGDDDDEPVEVDDEGAPLITKSIIFSQWTTMLDRIEDMLNEANIKSCRLDGTMSREERARQIERLRNSKGTEVMLVSTRAGGVGLNLTAASRAYLVDPYWNPSVEAQAIDRIHRMGQKRPVTAIKLMIQDSVEEKLNEIQKKKAELANLSLKNMSRAELMEQKAEQLASLFS